MYEYFKSRVKWLQSATMQLCSHTRLFPSEHRRRRMKLTVVAPCVVLLTIQHMIDSYTYPVLKCSGKKNCVIRTSFQAVGLEEIPVNVSPRVAYSDDGGRQYSNNYDGYPSRPWNGSSNTPNQQRMVPPPSMNQRQTNNNDGYPSNTWNVNGNTLNQHIMVPPSSRNQRQNNMQWSNGWNDQGTVPTPTLQRRQSSVQWNHGLLENPSNFGNTYNRKQSPGWNQQDIASSSLAQRSNSGMQRTNGYMVQGNSRQTFSPRDPWNPSTTSQVQLQSARPHSPIEATVDVWQGPDYTSRQMKVYSQDGTARPVRANFSNPRGYSHAVDVRNTGNLAFPVRAAVSQPMAMRPNSGSINPSYYGSQRTGRNPNSFDVGGGGYQRQTVQGGALKTFCFGPHCNCIEIDISTDGLPCYAKIEVTQGPGSARQIFDVYSDDGMPWQGVVDTTPGHGSTILVRNEGPMEFPIRCSLRAVG